MCSVEGEGTTGGKAGAGEGGRRGGRLFRLAVSCPQCGTRPALRVTEGAVRALARLPPHDRLGTYQCQRRRCGAIFEITAAAYHNAS